MKQKTIATYLVFIFLFLFLGISILDVKYAILEQYYILNYVKVFFEAGLIGGLADWFAIVAIFNKPFGLNIPHTNLIVKNKEKIAHSIADFVINNFLSFH